MENFCSPTDAVKSPSLSRDVDFGEMAQQVHRNDGGPPTSWPFHANLSPINDSSTNKYILLLCIFWKLSDLLVYNMNKKT